MKIGIFLLAVLISVVCSASVVTPFICPPPPVPPPMAPNTNNMMGPAAHNVVGNALELKEKAHSLLDQAMEQDLDVTEIEDLIAKADALLEMAQKIMRVNPIPATNMAREAADMYEDAISDLEALLG
ncbi:MAG: hypothetical protein HXS46_19390 [Theionarchaea archaeon]|nr:MAG: hypothetical protein AYK18_04220 [Theionarchaea archaeon DG-70]MBU7012854.1 hypothetical protein [Theionarchaea archaeon]